MAAPDSADPQPVRLPTEPTIRVARPPVPGAGKRADGQAPEVQPGDQPTVTLPGRAPVVRQGTLRFGRPAPVKVTVSARPRPRRRYRTWPWIAAVAVALLVLGVVLLVMLLHGATLPTD